MEEEIQSLKNKLQELELKKQEEENRKKDPFRYLKQRIEHYEEALNKYKKAYDNKVWGEHNKDAKKTYENDIIGMINTIGYEKAILNTFAKHTLQISNLIAYSKELEQRIDKLEKQLINNSDIDLLDIESL